MSTRLLENLQIDPNIGIQGEAQTCRIFLAWCIRDDTIATRLFRSGSF